MEMDDIKVEQVGLDGIGSTTRLSGTLTSNQELTHMISSRVPGRIQKLKVRATGRYISKGAPLYEIYSEELLALQNEYLMMLEQNRQLGGGNEKYASFVEAASKKLILYGIDRKSVVEGKSETVRVDLGGGRSIKKKKL